MTRTPSVAPGGARHAPIDRDLLALRIVPAMRALIRLGYFSFEAEGLEHVPRTGPAVYASNHAGWFALDAFVLGYAVAQALGPRQTPYFAAHDSALSIPALGPFLRRVGGVPASWFRRPERLPPEIEACGIFPEGVQGNCKPFWRAYRMEEWSRGFVRLAMAREAPIVPVAVLGGEECLPVAWTVRLLEPIIGSVVGLPLAPFPLPTRWKVIFHEPVRVTPPGGERAAASAAYCDEVAARIQGQVQRTLDRASGSYALGRLSTLVEKISGLGPIAGLLWPKRQGVHPEALGNPTGKTLAARGVLPSPSLPPMRSDPVLRRMGT